MDNGGIVVDDLEATVDFFRDFSRFLHPPAVAAIARLRSTL
jgi:hypothetical protein